MYCVTLRADFHCRSAFIYPKRILCVLFWKVSSFFFSSFFPVINISHSMDFHRCDRYDLLDVRIIFSPQHRDIYLKGDGLSYSETYIIYIYSILYRFLDRFGHCSCVFLQVFASTFFPYSAVWRYCVDVFMCLFVYFIHSIYFIYFIHSSYAEGEASGYHFDSQVIQVLLLLLLLLLLLQHYQLINYGMVAPFKQVTASGYNNQRLGFHMWATVATIHHQHRVISFFSSSFFYISSSIGALHRGIISVDSFSMFHPKSPAVHREREKYREITARSWKTNSGEEGFSNCFYIHLQCIYMHIKFGYTPVAFQWSLQYVFIDQWLSKLSRFFQSSALSCLTKTNLFVFSQSLRALIEP